MAPAPPAESLSEGAVRQRMHRGTLQSDRDGDGRVFVFLTQEDTEKNGVNTDKSVDSDPGLLDELRDRIRFLEEELADRNEESRRKDTIIAQINQTIQTTINRIPELEAPSEPS